MKLKSYILSILSIGVSLSASGSINPTVTVTYTPKCEMAETAKLLKAPSRVASSLIDHFTASTFGIPTGTGGTSYTDFYGYSNVSGTYYYCNLCQNPTVANGKVIQIHSKNSNSGIVSRVSVGTCKKIIVYWNESTYDGERVLQIYGKGTPYNTPADLYSSATYGTFLGEITYNSGYYTTVTIEGTCPYIGIRSKSGAQYLEFIEFTWENNADIPVTGISLSATSLTLSKGQSAKLVATVSPSNATNQSVTWGTSNASIAKVSTDGNVTGVSEGTTSIVARCGNYSATCEVTVKSNCETPVFYVQNNLLYAKCGTQGATTHLTVSPNDNMSVNLSKDQGVSLSGQYSLQAYATASGYDNSATAYGVLVWTNAAIKSSSNNIIQMEADRPLVFTTTDSHIHITGTDVGEEGKLYSLDGLYLGSFITEGGTYIIPYEVNIGEMYIVTIGNDTIKILVK